MGINIHPIICISDVDLAAETTQQLSLVLDSNDIKPTSLSYKPIGPGAMPYNLVDNSATSPTRDYKYDPNVSGIAITNTQILQIMRALYENYSNGASTGGDSNWESDNVRMGTIDCLCDPGAYICSNVYALNGKNLIQTDHIDSFWGINRQSFPINFFGGLPTSSGAESMSISGGTIPADAWWFYDELLLNQNVHEWGAMTTAVSSAAYKDFELLQYTKGKVEQIVKTGLGAKFAAAVGISLPAIETTARADSSFGLTSQTACIHYSSTHENSDGFPSINQDLPISLDIDEDGKSRFYINVLFPKQISLETYCIMEVGYRLLSLEQSSFSTSTIDPVTAINLAGAVSAREYEAGSYMSVYSPTYSWKDYDRASGDRRTRANVSLANSATPKLVCDIADKFFIQYDSSLLSDEDAYDYSPKKITIDSPGGNVTVVFELEEVSTGSIKYSCTSHDNGKCVISGSNTKTYSNYVVTSWRITFEGMTSDEDLAASYLRNTVITFVGRNFSEIILERTDNELLSYNAYVTEGRNPSTKYTFALNASPNSITSANWSISLTPGKQVSSADKVGRRNTQINYNCLPRELLNNPFVTNIGDSCADSYFSSRSDLDKYCLHLGNWYYSDDSTYSSMCNAISRIDDASTARSYLDRYINDPANGGCGMTITENNKLRYDSGYLTGTLTATRISKITNGNTANMRLLSFGGAVRDNFGCVSGHTGSEHSLSWNIKYNASAELKKLYYGYELGFAQQPQDPSTYSYTDSSRPRWTMLDSVNNNVYLKLNLSDSDAADLSSGRKTWEQLNVPMPVVFLRNKYADTYDDVVLTFLRFGAITNSKFDEATECMDVEVTHTRDENFGPHSISNIQNYCKWGQESYFNVPFATGNYTKMWNNPDLMYSENILLGKPYANAASYDVGNGSAADEYDTVMGYNTFGKCSVKLFTSNEHMNSTVAPYELNFASQDIPASDFKMPNLKRNNYMMFTIPLPTLVDGNNVTDINDVDPYMGKNVGSDETAISSYYAKLAKNSSYPTAYKYKLQLCPIGNETVDTHKHLFVIDTNGNTKDLGADSSISFVSPDEASKITYNIYLIYPGLRYERNDETNYDVSKVTNLALYTHNWNNDLGADSLVNRHVASTKTALEIANTKISLMYKYKYNEEHSNEDDTNGTWKEFDKMLFSDSTYDSLDSRHTLFGRIFAHACPPNGIHFFSFDNIIDEDGHTPEDYESQTFRYYLEQLAKIGDCAKNSEYSYDTTSEQIKFRDNRKVDPSTSGQEFFNSKNNNYYDYNTRSRTFPGRSVWDISDAGSGQSSGASAKEFFSGLPFSSSTDESITIGNITGDVMYHINHSWDTNCRAYVPNTVVIYNNRTDDVLAVIDDVYGISSENPYSWIINLINLWSKTNESTGSENILDIIKYIYGEIISEKYNINIIHSAIPANGFNKSISVWPSRELPTLPKNNNILSNASSSSLKPTSAGTYTFDILGIDASNKAFLTEKDFIKDGAEFETLHISITQA